jgi:hypothetical protein
MPASYHAETTQQIQAFQPRPNIRQAATSPSRQDIMRNVSAPHRQRLIIAQRQTNCKAKYKPQEPTGHHAHRKSNVGMCGPFHFVSRIAHTHIQRFSSKSKILFFPFRFCIRCFTLHGSVPQRYRSLHSKNKIFHLPHPQANSPIRTKSTYNSQKSKPIQTPNVPLHQTKNINQKSSIMATIKKGILGGFSGKVGTVVGANWKTTSYMRSLPKKTKKPLTKAQEIHRAKFAFAVNMLKPMAKLLHIGWKLEAKKNQTPFNTAVSFLMNNAMIGTYPNYQIHRYNFSISRGKLTPALKPRVDRPVKDYWRVLWDDNSGVGKAKPTDKALIVILNRDKKIALTFTDTATRSSGSQGFDFPVTFKKSQVEVYLGFVSEDGKEVSNSVYVGTIVVNV